MFNGATMGAVCCVHQCNPSKFTTFFPTRNWIELTEFLLHNRQQQSLVALPGRNTNLLSRRKTDLCSFGNCHQSAKDTEQSSPLCSNSQVIKVMFLIAVSTRALGFWPRATKAASLNSGCLTKATSYFPK